MPRLTDELVQRLSPAASEYHIWDTRVAGFGVRVRPTGGKSYVLYYRPRTRKRVRKLTISKATSLPVQEARRIAQEALGEVAKGKDPADKKLAYRDASLRAIFDEFKAKHLPTVSREHAYHRVSIFERHFLPRLGDKVLKEITRSDIKPVIDAIARRHPIAACNAQRGISAFLSWCHDRGYVDYHVLRGAKLPAPYRPRERALDEQELQAVWRACGLLPAWAGVFFRMLIVTGQRRREVAWMRWDEIDLNKGVWTLPAHRAKNRQQHIVPITDLMRELLDQAPGKVDYVFPAPSNASKPLSSFGHPSDALRARCSDVKPFRIHDLRRTVASLMGKIEIRPHVIEAVLNHKSGIISGIAAIYNKYTYEKEKKDAFEHYHEYLRVIIAAHDFEVTRKSSQH